MKTKYVKVPVSERLPEKEGYCSVIFKDSDTIRDYYHGKNVLSENFWKNNIEYWLEEKEDHSEEMEEMLNDIFLELDSLWDHESNNSVFGCIDITKIEELINKVKDNG